MSSVKRRKKDCLKQNKRVLRLEDQESLMKMSSARFECMRVKNTVYRKVKVKPVLVNRRYTDIWKTKYFKPKGPQCRILLVFDKDCFPKLHKRYKRSANCPR